MDQQKVGRFLKTLRRENSLTQAELAEALGVSDRSVSRWETGATMPDFDLLLQLAKRYDVEIGEILDGERKGSPVEKETEELMGKIADYNNVEREFFSKRMCVMFAAALAGLCAFLVLYLLGLERTAPYVAIAEPILGFVGGTLVTGLLYASRYISRLKAARTRLLKGRRG